MLRFATVLAGLLALANAPAWGQAKPIEVAADAPYEHKHTGLGFPPAIGDLVRDRVADGEADEHDVSVNYTAPGGGSATTFYIYPLKTGTLPVWFDRAIWAIENRPIYGGPRRLDLPAPFAPPGETMPSAMAAYYAVESGDFVSTAVAIVPVDDWLVKVRISSQEAAAETLQPRMMAALAALDWPRERGDAPAAIPVAPCTTAMRFANEVRSIEDSSLQLQNLLIRAAVQKAGAEKEEKAKDEQSEPLTYCRDGEGSGISAVYRDEGSTTGYLLALSDAGRGVQIYESVLSQIMGMKDKEARPFYAVDFHHPMATMVLPVQDGLPSPARVGELLEANVVVGSLTDDGGQQDVKVNPDFLKD